MAGSKNAQTPLTRAANASAASKRARANGRTLAEAKEAMDAAGLTGDALRSPAPLETSPNGADDVELRRAGDVEADLDQQAALTASALVTMGLEVFNVDPATVPTLSEAKQDAGVPEHVNTEYIGGLGEVIIVAKDGPKAMQQPDGRVNMVYMVAVLHPTTGKRYTAIMGGAALVRELSMVKLPFRTKLGQVPASVRGMSPVWIFESP